MAQISTAEFKTGICIHYDNKVWTVIDFHFLKMQQRTPTVKTKIKDVRTGRVLEVNFRSGEKFEQAHAENKDMQFMYKNDDSYVFLDMQDYEEKAISNALIGDAGNYITENAMVMVRVLDGEIIGVELPAAVALEVTEAEPAVKGNTATGAMKNATVSTGLQVQVPLFISEGDRIKIDTRSGEYLSKE